jgi:hypothetical protein
MDLNMTVYKVEGPNHTQIIEPTVYQNLSDYLRINSHGMNEVKIDLDKMKVQGSNSFVSDVD